MKPDGEEALEKYLAVVGPLIENAGAKLVTRYETTENLSGSEIPQFVSIIEYPSEDAIKMVFENAEYIALKPVREKAFSCYDVCVVA